MKRDVRARMVCHAGAIFIDKFIMPVPFVARHISADVVPFVKTGSRLPSEGMGWIDALCFR